MGRCLLFRVPGDPRAKGRPRFTKSGRAYTPSATRCYEAQMRAVALQAARLQGWLKPDKKTPLRVQVSAWFAVPASWSRKKREAAYAGEVYPTKKPDADNVAKCLDALNDVVWHDDSQVVEVVVRKRYCGADDAPHLTVCVETIPTMSGRREAALSGEADG